MFALSGVFGFTLFAFWVFTIFDVATTNKEEIRRYNKPIWLLILVLGMTLGSVSWYLVGRPKAARASRSTATSDAPETEFGDAPAPEVSDAPATKSSEALGFKLPSREDVFGIDADRPRGPEDDDAWLANVTQNSISPEESVDFAAWEADFETDQDSGSNA